MAYAVFEFKKGDKARFDQALEINVKDPATGKLAYDPVADLLRKQSIVVKEGQGLGLDPDHVYVLIEGSEDALRHAAERIGAFASKAKDGERIRQRIKDEEEAAAGGVGFIFG